MIGEPQGRVAVKMHLNREVVSIDGVVIFAAIFGSVLFFYSFGHSVQMMDYCNTLNNKIVGEEQRVLHVCGDIIC